MNTPAATTALPRKSGTVQPATPIIVRLEKIPATTRNRKHVEDRVRQLNRILDDFGVPLRLRLL